MLTFPEDYQQIILYPLKKPISTNFCTGLFFLTRSNADNVEWILSEKTSHHILFFLFGHFRLNPQSKLIYQTFIICSQRMQAKAWKTNLTLYQTQKRSGITQPSLTCQERFRTRITHQRPWETFQNTIVDVIDIFRINSPTVTRKFVRKWNWDKYLSQCLLLKHLICQSCLFRLCHLADQCLRIKHKQRGNEHYTTNSASYSEHWHVKPDFLEGSR